jgi:predicted DNA-binding transcriptional regulator AlpA
MQKNLIPQRKLNVREAAAFLALSKRTLEKYRSIGCGPAYLKLGSKVVYDIRDLETWVSSRRRTSTSQTAQSCHVPSHA